MTTAGQICPTGQLMQSAWKQVSVATPSGTAEEEELSMNGVRLEMHPASNSVSILRIVLLTGVPALPKESIGFQSKWCYKWKYTKYQVVRVKYGYNGLPFLTLPLEYKTVKRD